MGKNIFFYELKRGRKKVEPHFLSVLRFLKSLLGSLIVTIGTKQGDHSPLIAISLG